MLQDPFASLNPVHKVRYILGRPLQLHGLAGDDVEEISAGVCCARLRWNPPNNFIDKFPHELSGGQRQRVSIARGLAVQPRVLLADEPVSMLDVSIRLGILNLLADLRDRDNLAILYVTHDIASARYLADTIMVMYAGRVVEAGPADDDGQFSRSSLHAAIAVRRPRTRKTANSPGLGPPARRRRW